MQNNLVMKIRVWGPNCDFGSNCDSIISFPEVLKKEKVNPLTSGIASKIVLFIVAVSFQ